MSVNTNIIRIPTSIDTNFFKYWFEFLKPFHKLTNRECDVAAAFLKERYELAKVIKDDAVLDKVLMDEDGKRKIKEKCGLSTTHFQRIMAVFRDKNIVVDNIFNKKFIPNIEEDAKDFKLTLYFDLSKN